MKVGRSKIYLTIILQFVGLTCAPAQDVSSSERQFEELAAKFSEYALGSVDSADYLGKKIMRYARATQDSTMLLRACNANGLVQGRLGNYDSALYYYFEAIDFALELNSPRLSQVYNFIGILYQEYREYDLALEFFFKSLNNKDPSDIGGVAMVNNNIGLVYRSIGNCDLAIEHFLAALPTEKAGPLANIGHCYLDLGKYDSAIVTFTAAIDTIGSFTNDHERLTLIESYIGLGYGHLKKTNLKESGVFFRKVEQIIQQDDFLKLISYYQNLSMLKEKQDSLAQATILLIKAEILSKKIGSKSRLAGTYRQMSELYGTAGDSELAYYYLRKSDSLDKEMALNDRIRKIGDLEIKEANRSSQVIIQDQSRQLEKQAYFLVLLAVSLGSVCIIIVVVYRNNRFRKRANDQLQETLKELRTTQDQLVTQEKMAALGQLVSGIAHEINTPLGVIQGLISPVSDHFSFVVSQLHHGLKDIPGDKFGMVLGWIQKYTSKDTLISTLARRNHKKRLIAHLSERGLSQRRDLADKLLDIGITDEDETIESLLSLHDPVKMIDLIHSIVMHERGTAQMETVVNKISKMVSALQTYSQPNRSGDRNTPIDLRENIDQALVLLGNEFKHGIRLVKQYPEKLSLIKGNPDSLGQVWTNVLMNAIQAVEGKGTITIIIEELPERILVKVMDDGYGIPGEACDKIFEAFYTTKKRGYGTGLGLNISKRIVEQHGGKINFENKARKTVFAISLLKHE